jgi:23S rRNA (uracil1939-C5)-methyltransferase
MDKAELYIESLTSDGWGIANWVRPDNLVRKVAVPAALPGETVEVEITRCKKKKTAPYLGSITSIKTSSPLRIIPKCRHFALCGGCVYQMMPYEEQLRIKETKIKDLFCELVHAETKLLPIIASPSPWQYRSKMEFSFSQDKEGQKFLGLMIRASKGRVFNLEECHLMAPWVAELAKAVRHWWQQNDLQAYYLPKNRGSLRTLTLREAQSTGDRVVILTVSGNPDYAIKRSMLDEFVHLCQSIATPNSNATLTVILRIQQIAKGRETEFFEMRLSGPDAFRERVKIYEHELEFFLSPSSFFQPNALLSSSLYRAAIDMANLTKDQVLYDLYAGVGVFGMVSAHLVKEVIAIELTADSSYDARTNSQRLGLKNFRIIQGDVGEVLKDKALPCADVAICDPPRSGLGKAAIAQVLKLLPKTFVYVSCNPATQAQDIRELVQAGYKLQALQPIDQFPQTVHCENIAVLVRKRAEIS